MALGLVVTWVWAARVILHLQMENRKKRHVLTKSQIHLQCKQNTVFVQCSLKAGLDPHLTGCTSEALRAFTHESVQQGVAAAPVPTRTAGTAVPLNLTVSAHESRLANTLVASGHLLAQRQGVSKNSDQSGRASNIFF